MKIGLVHLSDLHVKTAADVLRDRIGLIGAAVRAQAPANVDLIVLFSGDVAYSGQSAEYLLADGFFHDLKDTLAGDRSGRVFGPAVIPGNHDCDFRNTSEVRPILLSAFCDSLAGYGSNGDLVQQILRVQESFFDFEARVSAGNSVASTSRLGWVREYKTGDKKVLIRCVNTALTSRLEEQAGQLCFPADAIPSEPLDADFIVTLLHHPYGWLAPENSREIKRRIETISDLVLTGHEHWSDSYTRIDRGGDETRYVEGAALNAEGVTGFNLIIVDFSESTCEIFRYRWNGELYDPEPSDARIFMRKASLLESRFDNNAEFAKSLNELGTGFVKPNGKKPTLDELFVWPELKFANILSKNKSAVHSSDVAGFASGKDYLQIAGPATSGRSTLAKALYRYFQQSQGLTPLLLDGRSMKGGSKNELGRVLDEAVVEQYRASVVTRFQQLEREKKVLIIDDWHRFRSRRGARLKTLSALREKFGKVIVFSDDISLFQLATDAASGEGEVPPEYCEIKPLGFKLRTELIVRWHAVMDEDDLDDIEFTSRVSASENLLDILVRKGAVPSRPLFILSILQLRSSATQETGMYGSYGHLYEALMTKRMSEASKKKNILGMKYTYLSLVAYDLFSRRRVSLAESELWRVHELYQKEYKVKLDASDLWKELEAADILRRSGGEFSFTYKYAYYFSVAKYFQQGIADKKNAESLRRELTELVESVHDEDSSNILIFYIYLTKDRDVITQMLEVSQRVFAGVAQAKLADDIEFINVLRSTPPDIVLREGTVTENRDGHRSELDSANDSEADTNAALARTKYGDDISDALKVEFAFKSLDVMGQVLKNFPLDLKEDLKEELMVSSYRLSLRTLRWFLTCVEGNVEAFIDLFGNAYKLFQPSSRKSPENIRDLSRQTMVRLTDFCVLGQIRRLSLAVGVAELRETYDEIREKADKDDIATALIDLAIKLDHFGQIPEEDVQDLEFRVRNNITAYTILRLLIAQFLELFPCPYQVQQRMAQLLKFKTQPMKMVEKLLRPPTAP
ncbi:MAG TPA: metallophosphoesterase [Terriglobales bacterium]|jgi:hypothetical protein|nr:metallophosphoesterase [Terriglobales bacterium]